MSAVTGLRSWKVTSGQVERVGSRAVGVDDLAAVLHRRDVGRKVGLDVELQVEREQAAEHLDDVDCRAGVLRDVRVERDRLGPERAEFAAGSAVHGCVLAGGLPLVPLSSPPDATTTTMRTPTATTNAAIAPRIARITRFIFEDKAPDNFVALLGDHNRG